MFTKAFNNLKKEGSQSSYNVISNDHDALLDNLRYAKSSDVTKSGVAVAAGVTSLAGGLGPHINNGPVQSLPAFKSFESSYSQSQSMDNFDFELDSMPIKPMSMFSSMPTNLGHTQAQGQAQAQEFHIPLKNSNNSNDFNSFNNVSNNSIQQNNNGQGKGGVTKSHSDSKLQNYSWNFPSMVQTQAPTQETQMQTEAQGPLCDQFGSLKLDNGLGLDVDFGIPPMKTMGQASNGKDSADLGMTSFVPFGSVFARDTKNNNNSGNVQGYNNKFSNIREEESEVIFVPPSKLSQSGLNAERVVRKEDGCFIKPQYYNEYTSCTMAETPIFVLNSVFNLLDRDYGYGFNDSNNNLNNNDNNNINNCDNNIGNNNDNSQNNSDNRKEADYSRETEVSMNEKDYEINGLVYMKHKQIKFRVSVWHERESNESDLTRIEFLRLKGDKMLFEQFWTEVYELMHTQLQFKDIDSVSPRCTSQEFESLFMPKFEPFKESSDMESDIDTEAAYTSETDSDFTMGNTVSVKDELNNITMDLMQDYREDGIDALADLYDMLDEKEDDGIVYGQNDKNSNDENNEIIRLVATHDILMKILIEKVLSHCDACHVRGGLCVLTKIISLMMTPQTGAIQQNGAMTASAKVASKESEVWLKRLIEDSILLDQLLLLLEKADLGRILKRHSIRLLSQIFLHYSPIDVNVFNVSKFGRLSNCIKSISLSGDVLRDYTMQQMLKIIENRLVSLQLLSLSEKGNDQAKRASQSLSALLTY